MKKINSAVKSISDYVELFGSEVGQKVLFDLMKNHWILSSTYVPGDPYSSAFNEGERSVVLRILRKSKTDIKKFAKSLETIQKHNEEMEDG